MNSKIDYSAVSQSVKTELQELLNEKSRLEVQIGSAQTRLAEISLREEKLVQLTESLADLLSLQLTTVGAAAAVTAPAVELLRDAAPEIHHDVRNADNFAAEKTIEQQSPPAAQMIKQSRESGDLLNFSEPRNDRLELPNSDPQTRELKTPVQSNQAEDEPRKNPANFDRSDFFRHYPHLKNAQQPVSVLAVKLLEYFNAGLSLKSLTQLIVALGYQHKSQNFTDTVHSTLKRKRATTGDFRYNAKQKIWELSYWQSRSDANLNNKPEAPAKADQKSVEQTQKVSNQISNAPEKRQNQLERKPARQHAIKVFKPNR